LTAATATSQKDMFGWLAQLSVNIVDYIDEDDVMTKFHWHPTAGNTDPNFDVYGVEMPKVVLNEVYMEVTNGDNSNQFNVNNVTANHFEVNIWAELHNTMVPPVVNSAGNTQYNEFVTRYTEWLANGPAATKYS